MTAVDANHRARFNLRLLAEVPCADGFQFFFGGVNRLLETFGEVRLQFGLSHFVKVDRLARNQSGAFEKLKIVVSCVPQFRCRKRKHGFSDALLVQVAALFVS
ncbi:MAG: hypothetical protein ACR65U_04310 [Methylocystis sp.]